MPWFPSDVQANDNTFWAHIDIDILKPASPMWTFPGNLRMQGDSARILEQVLDELKARGDAAIQAGGAGARRGLAAERDARLERAKTLAADKGKPDEINPHYLFAELDKLLEPDDLVFNEGVRNAGAALDADQAAAARHASCAPAAAGSAGRAAWRSAPSSPRPSG